MQEFIHLLLREPHRATDAEGSRIFRTASSRPPAAAATTTTCVRPGRANHKSSAATDVPPRACPYGPPRRFPWTGWP